MKKLTLFLGLMIGFNLAASEIGNIIDQQRPFYLYPNESNGLLTYVKWNQQDCDFAFRDGVKMRKSNGHFQTYWSTKFFNFKQIHYFELEKSHAPEYFTVIIGAYQAGAVMWVENQYEDEDTGWRDSDDWAHTEAYLRFDNEELAEQAHVQLKKEWQRCQ